MCIYDYRHICIHVYVCICIYIYIHMHTYKHMYIYIYTHKYIHTYTYTHTCMWRAPQHRRRRVSPPRPGDVAPITCMNVNDVSNNNDSNNNDKPINNDVDNNRRCRRPSYLYIQYKPVFIIHTVHTYI